MPGNKKKRLRELNLSKHHGRWNIDFMIEEKLVEGRLGRLDEFAERLAILQEDAPECLVVFLERLASFENEKNDNYSGQFECRPLLEGLDIVMPAFDRAPLVGPWENVVPDIWKLLQWNQGQQTPVTSLRYEMYWW